MPKKKDYDVRDGEGDLSEFDVFICETCANNPEMNFNEMIEHIKTVHEFDTSLGIKWTRTPVRHIDWTDCYQWDYRYTHEEIVLSRYVRTKRIGG